MAKLAVNKRKIINDPVYGFISFPYESNFRLIEHPYIQRLRRIRQLGQTNYVYPGANHTRFQHVLGAGYLMSQAIQVIRSKGHIITEEEEEAAINAMLLHDIGHGPFSHSLEKSVISGITHETLSLTFMHQLNQELNGSLDLAIRIFTHNYPKNFLSQLVSGQLDMDRLDYLKRDSFFTGVTEGVIGSDRIIKMLNVHNGELVVESKGIYSVEKFLIARRLMFWQVYLHKTVVSAENLLIKMLQRARFLSLQGMNLYASPALNYFLTNDDFHEIRINPPNTELLKIFASLDDTDIISASKVWAESGDPVLELLCNSLLNRKLFKIEIQKQCVSTDYISEIRNQVIKKYKFSEEDCNYLVHSGELENRTYSPTDDKINILHKNGTIQDIEEASDIFDLKALAHSVKKYFLTYPKDL